MICNKQIGHGPYRSIWTMCNAQVAEKRLKVVKIKRYSERLGIGFFPINQHVTLCLTFAFGPGR